MDVFGLNLSAKNSCETSLMSEQMFSIVQIQLVKIDELSCFIMGNWSAFTNFAQILDKFVWSLSMPGTYLELWGKYYCFFKSLHQELFVLWGPVLERAVLKIFCKIPGRNICGRAPIQHFFRLFNMSPVTAVFSRNFLIISRIAISKNPSVECFCFSP